MADIAREVGLDAAEMEWGLAGAGVVAGTILIPMLPNWVGNYTSLVVGAVLIVVAAKYIKEKEPAALLFGAGFAFALDGVLRLVMGSTGSTAAYLGL